MKSIVIGLLFGSISATSLIAATRSNTPGKTTWKGDWAKYRAARIQDNDCNISESENWWGA